MIIITQRHYPAGVYDRGPVSCREVGTDFGGP